MVDRYRRTSGAELQALLAQAIRLDHVCTACGSINEDRVTDGVRHCGACHHDCPLGPCRRAAEEGRSFEEQSIWRLAVHAQHDGRGMEAYLAALARYESATVRCAAVPLLDADPA